MGKQSLTLRAITHASCLALLSLTVACDRSKSRPPQLFIPISEVRVDGTVASPPSRATLPIQNTGGETLTYQLTFEDWMITPHRMGSVEPGGTAAISIQFECVVPGIRNGSIGITTNDPDFQSGSIPVNLSCRAPLLEIVVSDKSAVRGTVGSTAQGNINWHFTTPWLEQPPVGFTLLSPNSAIEISNSSGALARGVTSAHTIEFPCTEELNNTVVIVFEVGNTDHEEAISVQCEAAAEDPAARVAFYQGPLAATFGLFPDNEVLVVRDPGEILAVPNREAVLVVSAVRQMKVVGQLTLDDLSISIDELEHVQPAVGDAGYVIPAELVVPETVIEWHVVMPEANTSHAMRFTDMRWAPLSQLTVAFVPMPEGNSPVAAAAQVTEELLGTLVDLFPLGKKISTTVEQPVRIPVDRSASPYAALADRWFAASGEGEYFVGLVSQSRTQDCGTALDNFPVALIVIDSDACSPADELARQFGVTLGLRDSSNTHVPCGTAKRTTDSNDVHWSQSERNWVSASYSDSGFMAGCAGQPLTIQEYVATQSQLLESYVAVQPVGAVDAISNEGSWIGITGSIVADEWSVRDQFASSAHHLRISLNGLRATLFTDAGAVIEVANVVRALDHDGELGVWGLRLPSPGSRISSVVIHEHERHLKHVASFNASQVGNRR